jgi:hypothetical protein
VIIPYTAVRSASPLPSLGGARIRYRPLAAVRISGPLRSVLLDGQLDTGADDTVFHERTARDVGLDLTAAPQILMTLAGRGVIICRYARVVLRITDGMQETYEWSAVVGFVAVPLQQPLLGQAGFLQFFDVNYRGGAREAVLLPNSSFPGRRI